MICGGNVYGGSRSEPFVLLSICWFSEEVEHLRSPRKQDSRRLFSSARAKSFELEAALDHQPQSTARVSDADSDMAEEYHMDRNLFVIAAYTLLLQVLFLFLVFFLLILYLLLLL